MLEFGLNEVSITLYEFRKKTENMIMKQRNGEHEMFLYKIPNFALYWHEIKGKGIFSVV